MDEQETKLAKAVREHNELQPPVSPTPDVPAGQRRVEIVAAGTYNDGDDKAHKLDPGETLVTRIWYAAKLIDMGLAMEPAAPAISAETVQARIAELVEDLSAVVPWPGVREALSDAGVICVEDLRQASDEDLLAVPGIGAGRLQKIREAL